MLIRTPTGYGLGKRHWELETSSAVVEILPQYLNTTDHRKNTFSNRSYQYDRINEHTDGSRRVQKSNIDFCSINKIIQNKQQKLARFKCTADKISTKVGNEELNDL